MQDENKIFWQNYEFEYKEKTNDWFWGMGIVVVCLSIIAIIYDNPLFAIFMLIAGFTIFMKAKKVPRLIDFELSDKGIKIDGTLYSYGNLKSFWIEDNKREAPKMILKTEKFITPIIVIPLDTDLVDHEEIRNFLLKYLTEEKLIEPFSHKITEFLGF